MRVEHREGRAVGWTWHGWGTQNPGVGLNPFRQQRRRPTDYVMVAAAFAVVAVLIVWAALPR
jgi:hypothetical protein